MAKKANRDKFSTREVAIFAILASLMFITTAFVKLIPNVHLLALFIGVSTLVYRERALIPLYVYIFLDWAYHGFTMTWAPHLYIWLPLWLAFMIVGKIDLPQKMRGPLYMVICGLHGLSFGTLYAPAQALLFGLNVKGMIAWIAAGLPFDIIHAIGDFLAATLIIPLSTLLMKLDKRDAATHKSQGTTSSIDSSLAEFSIPSHCL